MTHHLTMFGPPGRAEGGGREVGDASLYYLTHLHILAQAFLLSHYVHMLPFFPFICLAPVLSRVLGHHVPFHLLLIKFLCRV